MLYNPPHPGEFIREICLNPLGLTVTKAAEYLGVTRKSLSALLNGKSGISPKMALRLGIAFNTAPESWLNQQVKYDLWQAKQESYLDVHPIWQGNKKDSVITRK